MYTCIVAIIANSFMTVFMIFHCLFTKKHFLHASMDNAEICIIITLSGVQQEHTISVL